MSKLLALAFALALAPALPAQSPSAGIPFGLFRLTGRDMVAPYDIGVVAASPQSILRDLAAARAKGGHLIVNFAGGGPSNVTDASGHFSFEHWKSQVDRFLPIAGALDEYARDGTLFAFEMIDEPFHRQRYGGEAIPLETLEQMAAYSKSVFPSVPTAVRDQPTHLRGYPWRSLDIAWAQYEARKGWGSAQEYLARQVASAREQRLGLIVGLNISKGGDGSSGLGAPSEWSMTSDEIRRDGRALLAEPYACAFLAWDARPEVIGRPDVARALEELAEMARAHPATGCRARGG